MVTLPFLIAFLSLAGTFTGLYLRGVWKTADYILPVVLTLIGFSVSIYLSYVITDRVASSQ